MFIRSTCRIKVNNYSHVMMLSTLGVFVSLQCRADNYFNPAFLSDNVSEVADLSRFEKDGKQAPGNYRVDIYLNKNFVTTKDLIFKSLDKNSSPETLLSAKDNTGLLPCLSDNFIHSLGVNISMVKALNSKKRDEAHNTEKEVESCTALSKIPDSFSVFNFEKQRLDISIPQAALSNNSRGYIPPDQWDEGVNALLLSYNFTGSNSSDHHSDGNSASNNYFLGLNGGINLGPWRLKDYSTWSYNSEGSDTTSNWQHINTFIQRTIIPLKGELTVGDSNSSSDVFDSNSFRGVQLESDDNMLPDSMKGFAPTIRGIAHSNAQVSIKQNGYLVYQTYVAPGAFEIKDLFPTSSSGDLQVEVKESSGQVTAYTIPYSSVPVLQREGRVKYAFTAGKFRSNNDNQEDDNYIQETLIWGLSHGVTVYGGSQFSQNYIAFAGGAGVNMGDFGAVSADFTHANTTLADDSEHSGQSVRFLYSKSLNNLGTNFQLAGYRYSTSGFYTLADSTYKEMSGYNDDQKNHDNNPDNDIPMWVNYYNLYYTKRGKYQVNISQQLGDSGSVFFSASKQSYWHTDDTDNLWQVGYNTAWNNINIGVSYNYSQSVGQPIADQILSFNISIPIGTWLTPTGDLSKKRRNIYTTYSLSTDKDGHTTQNAGLNGTLLDEDNLNYAVQQSYASGDTGASGNAGLSYQGTYGNVNAGYNYSENGDYQQVNYGVAGGVIAHANGITFSQPLGETNVLIAVPGADGVVVEDTTGVKTDWRGYTVVPYASTYRQNRMALDTDTLSDDVDIDDAVVNVVPTKGALVRASFKAQVGARALISLSHNNRAIPFGSVVHLKNSDSSSIVGDDGEVYMSGLPMSGYITVQWGAGKNCLAKFTLPDNSSSNAITHVSAICQ